MTDERSYSTICGCIGDFPLDLYDELFLYAVAEVPRHGLQLLESEVMLSFMINLSTTTTRRAATQLK